MFLKPNFDRVLAKKIEQSNKSVSGIELNMENDIEKAIVLDLASDIEKTAEIKIGDTIFFEPHTAIFLQNENLILIKLIDILGYEKIKG